jgi:hypothetical protein
VDADAFATLSRLAPDSSHFRTISHCLDDVQGESRLRASSYLLIDCEARAQFSPARSTTAIYREHPVLKALSHCSHSSGMSVALRICRGPVARAQFEHLLRHASGRSMGYFPPSGCLVLTKPAPTQGSCCCVLHDASPGGVTCLQLALLKEAGQHEEV